MFCCIAARTGLVGYMCSTDHRLQGQLTEGLDVVDYLMEQPNVVPRMNPLVLSTERQHLDFTANPGDLRAAMCIWSLIFIFSTI